MTDRGSSALNDDRLELLARYRQVLRRMFLFNSVQPIDPDVLTSTMALQRHLAEELGQVLAQAVAAEEAKSWRERFGSCPWCGRSDHEGGRA
jgi:hypothetical protein